MRLQTRQRHFRTSRLPSITSSLLRILRAANSSLKPSLVWRLSRPVMTASPTIACLCVGVVADKSAILTTQKVEKPLKLQRNLMGRHSMILSQKTSMMQMKRLKPKRRPRRTRRRPLDATELRSTRPTSWVTSKRRPFSSTTCQTTSTESRACLERCGATSSNSRSNS